MNIKDLEKNKGFTTLKLKIKTKEEPREVMGYDQRTQRVCTLTGEDNNKATIKITLWNNDIDNYKVGDTIEITNGYTKEYNDELYVTRGKNGKLNKP